MTAVTPTDPRMFLLAEAVVLHAIQPNEQEEARLKVRGTATHCLPLPVHSAGSVRGPHYIIVDRIRCAFHAHAPHHQLIIFRAGLLATYVCKHPSAHAPRAWKKSYPRTKIRLECMAHFSSMLNEKSKPGIFSPSSQLCGCNKAPYQTTAVILEACHVHNLRAPPSFEYLLVGLYLTSIQCLAHFPTLKKTSHDTRTSMKRPVMNLFHCLQPCLHMPWLRGCHVYMNTAACNSPWSHT